MNFLNYRKNRYKNVQNDFHFIHHSFIIPIEMSREHTMEIIIITEMTTHSGQKRDWNINNKRSNTQNMSILFLLPFRENTEGIYAVVYLLHTLFYGDMFITTIILVSRAKIYFLIFTIPKGNLERRTTTIRLLYTQYLL